MTPKNLSESQHWSRTPSTSITTSEKIRTGSGEKTHMTCRDGKRVTNCVAMRSENPQPARDAVRPDEDHYARSTEEGRPRTWRP